MQVVRPDDWYVVSDEGDGVSRIVEPHVSDLLAANIWHVRGRERDLVVDSGLGIVDLRVALPHLFERDPILVLSHAHLDHMGGAHEFGQCWVHAAEAEQVRRPSRMSLVSADLLAALGMSDAPSMEVPPSPQILIDAVPDATYDPTGYSLTPASVTRELAEGDVIDLGDRVFSVLHLPGHTPGSINLYDERRGDLFTGDVAYEGGLIDTCLGSDIEVYVATMQRLQEVPIRRALPGHGLTFGQSRLRGLAAEYVEQRTS
jgi:glyoxylase-like metal-dependent hydrolase (beta-lactamase superfamily II)